MAEIVKLTKNYTVSGKNISEIKLELEEMTTLTLIEAERDYFSRNKNSFIKELEYGWYLTVASISSGLKYGDFLKFSARDCVKIVNVVRGFLQNTDSEKTEEVEVVENLGLIE